MPGLGSVISSIAGDIIGGTQTAGGLSSGQNAYNAAVQNAIKQLQTQYQQTQSNFQPYTQAGTNALNQYMTTASQPYNYATYMNTPGYQFQLQQGQKGINASAAAQGKFYSPQTAMELGEFNQGLGSQYYQQGFNNMLSQQGMLGNILGLGANMTSNLGSLGGSNADFIAQLLTGQGANQQNVANQLAQNRTNMYSGILNTVGGMGGMGGIQGLMTPGGGMSGGGSMIPNFNLASGAGFGGAGGGGGLGAMVGSLGSLGALAL